VLRAVEGAVTKHRHEDPDPAVGHAAQGASMGVSARAEVVVIGSGCGITGGTDASPMIQGVPEAFVASATHHDDPALSTSAGDGCLATVGAKRGAICLGKQRGGFGEQGPHDDDTDTGKGPQDVDIAGSVTLMFVGELVQSGLEFLFAALALFVHNAEARQEQINVELGGFGSAGCDGDRWFAKDSQNLVGIPSADAVAFEQGSNAASLHTGPAIGADHALDELPEPRLVGGRAEPKETRGTAMDLITAAIDEAVELASEILVGPGELPDLKDERMIHVHLPKAGPVRAQSVRENVGIEPIILRSGHRVAVPEAIKLLRVQRVDVQLTLQEGLHEPSAGAFDGHSDPLRVTPDFPDQVVHEGGDVFRPVLDDELSEDGTLRVQQADLVRGGRPIDSHKKIVRHGSGPP